ncbi:hypothetical protein ScalyP_jg8470 [Parmales sp. scaly parma]|nr:hypothetical protein ScalyP_jg8470 [Parmales sp. scaly parma]
MAPSGYNTLSAQPSTSTSLLSTLGKFRPFLIVVALLTSVFWLLPISLQLILKIHLPDSHATNTSDLNIHGYIYPFVSGGFLVFLLYAGKRLNNDNKNRQQWRAEQRTHERIVDSTYRCFLPQAMQRSTSKIGDMVVFSVKIAPNSNQYEATPDAVIQVTDQFVTLRLSASNTDFADLRGNKEGLRQRQYDRRDRIEFLVNSCLALPTATHNSSAGSKRLDQMDYSVKVLGLSDGSGSGGPTGIAVAVLCKNFGGQLAFEVGRRMETSQGQRANAPPIHIKIPSKKSI